MRKAQHILILSAAIEIGLVSTGLADGWIVTGNRGVHTVGLDGNVTLLVNEPSFLDQVVFGSDSTLYINTYANDVRRYSLSGQPLGVFAQGGGLSGAAGMTFGPDGNLYVVSAYTNQVLRYDGTSGMFMDVFVDTGLSLPLDVIFGPDGRLYVSSFDNSRVLAFDGATGFFEEVFSTIGLPGEIGFGSDGRFYAVSHGSSSVFRFDGVTGEVIDEFIPSQYLDFSPAGFTFEPDGDFYLVDHELGQLQRYHPETGDFLGVVGGGMTAARYVVYVPEPHALLLIAFGGLFLFRACRQAR